MAWSFYDSTGQVLQGVLAGAIDSSEIADDAVTSAKIATDAVIADGIAANAVGASELANDAVDTAAIANDAVTVAKLANSINTEITANTAKTGITSGQASAITANTAKVTNVTHSGDVTGATALTIAADAVTTAKIADSQVTLAKLDNTARETNIQLVVIDFAIALTTGNGKFYFYVPATLNGFNIVAVHAEVITAPVGSVATFMLHNVTSGADILSTAITIDAGETGSDSAATAAVINTSEDDLTTHDIIRVDIDGVGSSTAGSGLIVNMTCRLP
jgi:hypothetical protein